nr:cpeT-like protein [Cryptomonas curvata]|mmetsp:Transcript_46531/g.97342  ORF Transcript_46531/g.97342 Transcript_46531/m.97342 type:complete len:220 (-) Transcript_46531:215-874(-)
MFVNILNIFKKINLIENKSRICKKKTLKMSKEMENFVSYISGEWSNKKQSQDFPALWAHIHVCYRPLPFDMLGMHSFYIESAFDYMIDKPYKTAVMGLNRKENFIEAKNFRVIKPEEYWFGSHDDSLLKTLNKDRLIETPSICSTIFEYKTDENIFIGITKPGKKCIINVDNKKTYLDSRITLSKDEYTSWDIGRDVEDDSQIWGATSGPFCFSKIRSF